MATSKIDDLAPLDEVVEDQGNPKEEEQPEEEPFLTPERIQGWLRTPAVQAGLVLSALIAAVFWTLISELPKLWFDANGYYQHAALVPLAIAALVFKAWPKLKAGGDPKPVLVPILFLVPTLILAIVLSGTGQGSFLALTFIAAVGFVVWTLAGFRWALGLLPAILFMIFAMPVWNTVIDRSTLNLQIFSTEGTYFMLKALQMNPLRDSPTVIYLDNFPLNIAAACSGMKQTLAMVSCVAFICLYADMKIWAKLVLALAAIPLAIFMNSFRITLIGVVGNTSGQEAGMWMHDYGSYGVLALSFFILYKLAQLLGWEV